MSPPFQKGEILRHENVSYDVVFDHHDKREATISHIKLKDGRISRCNTNQLVRKNAPKKAQISTPEEGWAALLKAL